MENKSVPIIKGLFISEKREDNMTEYELLPPFIFLLVS